MNVVRHSLLTPEERAIEERVAKARKTLAQAPPRKRQERRYPRVPNPWRLSATQVYILRALCSGASFKDLARDMHISDKTVSTHLTRARERMGIERRDRLAILQAWSKYDAPAATESHTDVFSKVQAALVAVHDAGAALKVAEESLLRVMPANTMEPGP